MSDAMAEAIEGLVKMTNSVMQKTQEELKITTDKMAAGPLTADDAVDAFVRLGTAWVNGIATAGVELFDAATTLAKYTGGNKVTSHPLKVGAPGAWTLTVGDPLTGAKTGAIDSKLVEVIPGQVSDGEKETFVVRVNGATLSGGMYAGSVIATNATGETKTVVVKVQVP